MTCPRPKRKFCYISQLTNSTFTRFTIGTRMSKLPAMDEHRDRDIWFDVWQRATHPLNSLSPQHGVQTQTSSNFPATGNGTLRPDIQSYRREADSGSRPLQLLVAGTTTGHQELLQTVELQDSMGSGCSDPKPRIWPCCRIQVKLATARSQGPCHAAGSKSNWQRRKEAKKKVQ